MGVAELRVFDRFLLNSSHLLASVRCAGVFLSVMFI